MVIAVAVVVHVQRIRQVWNWVIVWSARRVDKTPHVARQLESLETFDVILVESTRIWCSRKEPFQLSSIVPDLLGDNVTSWAKHLRHIGRVELFVTADDWAKGAGSKWQQGAPASHNIDVKWSQPSDFDELAVHYFGFNSAADQEILDAPRKLIAAEWSSGPPRVLFAWE